MKVRCLAVLWAGVTAASTGLLGCSSDGQSGAAASGGAAGISGASPLGGSSGSSGSSGSNGSSGSSGSSGADGGNAGAGTQSACLAQPAAQRTQGTVLSLSLRLVMGGKPFVFGQPNPLSDGGSLVPLNFRFYISEVELLPTGDAAPIAVDLVTDSGSPVPYGVHLFNAEDEGTSTVRVLAPAGQYAGLSFALGIKLSCNQQRPASLSEPLTDTSQMTWPHTGGFLFLRYEGRYTAPVDAPTPAPGSAAGIPPAVHMGGNIRQELVPRVRVSGALSVPASGALEKGLSLAMDEIFKGATSDLDVSDVAVGLLSTPEAVAGERLRRE